MTRDDRNDRNDYIDALEVDDDGDLNPLVAFTARRSILQTISSFGNTQRSQRA